jgi:sucrose phosphorylase
LVNGVYNKGLLEDSEIEGIMSTIMERGGRVKNLYDPSGNKIYYQVNATFFSALGEDDQNYFWRAIQMFMPGIPQVWYLDIFWQKIIMKQLIMVVVQVIKKLIGQL